MAYTMLNIGTSGLNAAQRQLDTTGHNISNVNTEGYSRQRVEQDSVVGIPFRTSLLGNGTAVTAIERAFDKFLYGNVLFNNAQFNYYETLTNQNEQLDDLLGDSDTGLTLTLESYFDSVNGVAEEPTLLSSRNVMLSNADSTAERINILNEELIRQNKAVNSDMENSVNAINEIAEQIALFNEQIQIANSGGTGSFTPNDLLDKRDQLVKDLSDFVDVQTLDRGQGMVDVSIGSGVTLVTGVQTIPLSVIRNEYDSTQVEITQSASGGTFSSIITGQMTGGSLTSLIDFRRDVLAPSSQELGKIAIGFADAMNRQQSLGLDLSGQVGQTLYQDVNDPAVAQGRSLNSSRNGLDSNVSVTIRNADLLTGEDYFMDYDGVNLIFSDTNGNALPPPAAPFPPPPPGTIVEIPGTGIGIEMVTNNLVAGDSFLIRPAHNGGENIELVMTDPRDVAAANNDLTLTDINNPNNATFELFAIDDITDPNFPTAGGLNPIRIELDAGGTNYQVTDGAGVVLVPFAPIPNDMPIEAAGMRFNLTGNIAGGEVFEIAANNPSQFGVGDNRNALAMLDFQTRKALDNGSNSFTETYAALITFVGIETQTSQVQETAFETSLKIAEEDMAATSGVNLDEEAADLIRFQQAYSASAQVISVANTIFDTLFQSIR